MLLKCETSLFFLFTLEAHTDLMLRLWQKQLGATVNNTYPSTYTVVSINQMPALRARLARPSHRLCVGWPGCKSQWSVQKMICWGGIDLQHVGGQECSCNLSLECSKVMREGKHPHWTVLSKISIASDISHLSHPPTYEVHYKPFQRITLTKRLAYLVQLGTKLPEQEKRTNVYYIIYIKWFFSIGANIWKA